ncbi:hypothetical protein SAMN05877753_102486 [Bacillus oleivorans]|uniref:Uncharacterized protein n=1 Tax=Bacillus oleivorans TaxID=1448271 RepID=A0A285CMS4_9BACI|nr:hypothetical protein [Bacillus oleivorans]SNX68356.1 hypothetical protein SAMN05877753_102486 [Bacillus oleivorans]
MNAQALLNKFSKVIHNRNILEDLEPKEQLQTWIKEDLLDLHTHPRLRKDKKHRFFLAIKKIIRSDLLEPADKTELIQIYIDTMEAIDANEHSNK